VIDALLAALRDHLADDGSADWLDDALVLHLGAMWEGRAAFVLFAASEPTARLVVKTDRTTRGRRRLQREHEALRSLAHLPALAGTMPRSVALFEHAGLLVLAQTALAGRTLAVDVRRRLRPTARRVTADHDRVLTWLHALQESATPANAERHTLEVDRAVALAEQVLPRDERWATDSVHRLAALGADAGTLTVPLVRSHGDLGPSNVLIERTRVGVVDWEGAHERAPAVNDVLLFLHHYGRATRLPIRGIRERHDVAAGIFMGTDVLARQTWRCWCAELERIGIPGDAARYVLFATLLQYAARTTEFAHRDHGSPMWGEIARRYGREWARQGFPDGAATGR
jgi:thiamine kinase-like enzyme